MKTLYRSIFDSRLSMKDQIYRLDITIGCIFSTISFVILLLTDRSVATVALGIAMTMFFACMVLTFRHGKHGLSQRITYYVLVLFVLPMLYWSFGGAQSLTIIWVVLLIFYLFHMFSGKELCIYFALTIALYGVLFYGSYHHPEFGYEDLTRGGYYLVSFFSVFGIGVVIGAILRIQVHIFDRERMMLEAQTKDLEDKRDVRSELYEHLSHEIRTPINIIMGADELMLRDEEIQGNLLKNAEKIGAAASLINNMVNDILDISLLENERLSLENGDYNTKDFFRGIANIMRSACDEKGLELNLKMNIEMPSVISGDERRVRQILLNILMNSVKFTEEGAITINAQGTPLNDKEMELRISIADTGIGIRKEEIESIFEPYRRSKDANDNNTGGAGLGLSISRRLARLMDGDITIDSIYKQGSIFTVTLKQAIVDATPIGELNIQEESRTRSGYEASFEAPRARILIVDDNEVNGIITRTLLEPTKMQIDVVRSGAECLMLAREKYYDVILMDFLMPRMNGVETFKELRRQENGLCRESAVLILTANMQTSAKNICQENGFDGYLEKPLYGATLEREILRFLPKEIVELRSLEFDEGSRSIADIAGKKRKKLYITTDCVCDLSGDVLERYDIKVIYMNIKTPGGTFIDTKEIDSSSLAQYLASEEENPVRPTAPSVRAFEEFFAEALTQAEEVIHISMASYAGDTYGNACEAAKGFAHVHVIDSGQVSCGEGILVQHAARMALEGYDVRRIIQIILEEKRKVNCYVFTPSIHAFMARNYIGPIAGNILLFLRLCPTIEIIGSKPRIGEITIGQPAIALRRFLHKHLRNSKKISSDMLMISYVNKTAREREAIQNQIKEQLVFQRVVVQRASFSTGCSAGDGAVCIAYLSK